MPAEDAEMDEAEARGIIPRLAAFLRVKAREAFTVDEEDVRVDRPGPF
jgi:hypothetical protein